VISGEVRDLVRKRAGNRCEYCLLHQKHTDITHHLEHIVAKQHGGSNDPANLALACHRCNLRKGPNLSGIDPFNGEVAVLFHPRRDRWMDHFRLTDVRIEGTTATGRATVLLLTMNDPRQLELRQELRVRGDLLPGL
jgi:hypothetical protein